MTSKINSSLMVGLIIGMLLGVGVMFVINPLSGGSATTYTISTAGSTTVYPLSQEWAAHFHDDNPAFVVNPSTGGSGLGQSQVADGLIDIGASSSYPDEDYRTENPNVKIIPISADALGVVANPSVNGTIFQMDCDMVVAIFQKNVTIWEVFETTFNVIVQATGDINVYVRSDASGTTATFAKWLETADDNTNTNGAEYIWNLGHKESVSWPVGVSAVDGNPGIASGVIGDTNAIGYVGLAFMNDMTPVDLYNPTTDEYVEPSLENALKAIPSEMTNPGDNLMNSATTGAYPIARLLFYLVNIDNLHWYTISYLSWVLVQGQQYISDIGYVPISNSAALDIAIDIVSSLSASG